jgi:hypothetical protein
MFHLIGNQLSHDNQVDKKKIRMTIHALVLWSNYMFSLIKMNKVIKIDSLKNHDLLHSVSTNYILNY